MFQLTYVDGFYPKSKHQENVLFYSVHQDLTVSPTTEKRSAGNTMKSTNKTFEICLYVKVNKKRGVKASSLTSILEVEINLSGQGLPEFKYALWHLLKYRNCKYSLQYFSLTLGGSTTNECSHRAGMGLEVIQEVHYLYTKAAQF